eukprot:TRINITY_DN95138_c0_g1_i1.p1 TRINITY_DN95138_c0_g1~~TRINITY_DN95138_c0_g1_i1.p1  ORF type:complete len:1133 (+),score=304.35 TRINITY_DN95138_c0_g1_i1:339-3401(+)
MVSSVVFVIVCGLLAAAAAFKVDAKQEEQQILAVDSVKDPVVDLPNQRDKLAGTLTFSFRRNHLIVGFAYRHKKLSREKRVSILIAVWLATEAITTVLHTALRFKANSMFIATGLVAGVLMFPMVQFMMFLYELRPETRIHHTAPPRSAPARPIPLKEQALAQKFKAPKRPAVGKVRPPLPTAAPRAPSSLQLPVMPTLQLSHASMKKGPIGKQMMPALPKMPTRPPPVPKPPQGPPPPGHLLVARGGGAPDFGSLTQGGSSSTLATTTSMGPWGLKLPELPPLPQGSLIKADGQAVPAPPPKRGGGGPKPPQAPPPLTKMFFAVPKGALPPKAAPLPPNAPPSITAKMRPLALPGPAMPKLPPMARRPPNQPHLSAVKVGGDSARGVALPPPPPPPPGLPKTLASKASAPLPPATPREEDYVTPITDLPGFMSTGDVSQATPRAQPKRVPKPPPPPPAAPAGPGQMQFAAPPEEDVELPGHIPASLAHDPEHTMAAPDDEVTSPSHIPGTIPGPPPKVGGPAAPSMGPPSGGALPMTAKMKASVKMGLPSSKMPAVPPPGGPKPPGGVPMNAIPAKMKMKMPALPQMPDMVPGSPSNAGSFAVSASLPAPPLALGMSKTGAKPPPMAPPPGALPYVPKAKGFTASLEGPQAGALALPPLRLAPGGESRLEEGPKHRPLELPSNILMKVPQVQKYAKGTPPPPPPPLPPPLPGNITGGQIAIRPLPPEDGEPIIQVRQLAKVKAGELSESRRPPKPPPKLPSTLMKAKPPPGPPPAHAIVLAKPMAIGDAPASQRDHKAILARAKPKPPSFLVHPPTEPVPDFVHKGAGMQTAVTGIMESRLQVPKAGLPTQKLPPGAPQLQGPIGASPYSGLEIVGGGVLKPKSKPPKPVPNWVRDASDWMVKVFVFGVVLESAFFIIVFGAYLDSSIVWATHAATITGCLVNLAIFESVKCVVIACVNLFKDELVKRQADEIARRARMALKAQRQQEKTSKFSRRAPSSQLQLHSPVKLQIPPPPLMG